MKTLTEAEWRTEAVRRYGPDAMAWRFRCPACGHVATVADWAAVEAPESAIAFSCVGRWQKKPREAFVHKADKSPEPCNYAGGGLFRIHRVEVLRPARPGAEAAAVPIFDFADDPLAAAA